MQEIKYYLVTSTTWRTEHTFLFYFHSGEESWRRTTRHFSSLSTTPIPKRHFRRLVDLDWHFYLMQFLFHQFCIFFFNLLFLQHKIQNCALSSYSKLLLKKKTIIPYGVFLKMRNNKQCFSISKKKIWNLFFYRLQPENIEIQNRWIIFMF